MKREQDVIYLSQGNRRFVRCRLLSVIGTFKGVEQFIRASLCDDRSGLGLKLFGFLDVEIIALMGVSFERLHSSDRQLVLSKVWKRFLDCETTDSAKGFRLRFRLGKEVQEAVNRNGTYYLNWLADAADAALQALADRYWKIDNVSHILSSRTVSYGVVVDAVLFPNSKSFDPIPTGLLGTRKNCLLEEVANEFFREAINRRAVSFPIWPSPSALLLMLAVQVRSKSAEGSERDGLSIDTESVRKAFRFLLSSRRRTLEAASEGIRLLERSETVLKTRIEATGRMIRYLDERIAECHSSFIAAPGRGDCRKARKMPVNLSPPSLAMLVQVARLVKHGSGDVALQFLAYEDPVSRHYIDSIPLRNKVDLALNEDIVRLARRVISDGLKGNALAIKSSARRFLYRCRKVLAIECIRQESLKSRKRVDSLRELEGCLVARKALELELAAGKQGTENVTATKLLQRARMEAAREILPSFIGENGKFAYGASDTSQTPSPVSYAVEMRAIEKRLREAAGPLLNRPHSNAFAMRGCPEEGISAMNRICNRFLEMYKVPR